MNLRQIEIFRAIMLTGSVTDAARLLHVTQPGISRAARHLETSLGVSLFERQKGRLAPTQDALRLFAEIENMYRGVQSVQEFAQGLKRGEHARLRIVSSPSVGLRVVPQAIARLQQQLPGARFTLDVLAGQQLVEMLVNRQADVGVLAIQAEHPLLEVEVIGSVPLMCVFPESHELANKRSISAKDAAGYPFISFGRETYQGRLIGGVFDAAGLQIDPVVNVRFARTACAMVSAGAGIAFVDALTAEDARTSGIDYRPVRPATRVEIGLVRPRSLGLSSLGAAFFDQVKRLMRQ